MLSVIIGIFQNRQQVKAHIHCKIQHLDVKWSVITHGRVQSGDCLLMLSGQDHAQHWNTWR